MELKGGKLLDKIRSLNGSINLLTYRGNLREVAVECGYIRKDRIQRKDINDEKFFHFCKSYWRALLDAPESNSWNPKRFNRPSNRRQVILNIDLFKIFFTFFTAFITWAEFAFSVGDILRLRTVKCTF